MAEFIFDGKRLKKKNEQKLAIKRDFCSGELATARVSGTAWVSALSNLIRQGCAAVA